MDGLMEKYMAAVPEVRAPNSTCGEPRDDAFNILRDPAASDNPWPGLLLQSTLGCLWYWCADQVRNSLNWCVIVNFDVFLAGSIKCVHVC